MKFNLNFKIIIFIYAIILISNKYLISIYFNPFENFFFKIFRYSEADFFHYALIVQKLSTLSLVTDWSNFFETKKIIGFPIFSIIWHSLFFKFFGYYSFLILEYFFYSLNLYLLFIFFNTLIKNKPKSLLAIFLIYFFLEIFELLNYFFSYDIIDALKLPLYEFIGNRFPRPLITSTYFLLFLYSASQIFKKQNFFIKKKYLYTCSLCLSLLLNSFFYLFICLSIFFIMIFFLIHKNNILINIKKNIKLIFINFFIITIGFIVFYTQGLFVENDYPQRIGVFLINFKDKIFLIKHFFYKLLQIEIISLILISLFLKFFFININRNNNKFNILYFLFFSSLISPFVFIILTNKIISLYHFWTIVKFTGFLYIYLIIYYIITKVIKTHHIKYLTIIFFFLSIGINFCTNLIYEKKIDSQLVLDQISLKEFLIKQNYFNNEILLNTDNHLVNHLWLKLNNSFFINKSSFVSSLKDTQIEDLIFNQLKLFDIDYNTFSQMLNHNENKLTARNNFASIFNYKYSVNSIRHYIPIENEYSPLLSQRIISISPLIQWYTFFPNSEKKRFLNKFKSYNINENFLSKLLILNNNPNLIHLNNLNMYYDSIYSNKNFNVFKKKD